MGWLKGAVIGMAVLIAIGMGLLVYGVVTKTGPTKPADTGSIPRPPSPAPPKAFGTVKVDIPDGCRVEEIVPDGERVYLLVGPADTPPCDAAIVVDPATGRTLGTLRFRP